MKKLLFRKFAKDTFKFFSVICLSIGLIVWVIQAVGYLDIVTEDGHSIYVYFSYSILNFPKIISRIFPFVFFISLFYQISQYELKNELLIFWTNGINRMQFINVIIAYSIIVLLFQVFLSSYLAPLGQDKARSFIRNSNIDFFPSLIKEGKFIDTVSNLTIFIESKDDSGNYKNIFLKDDLDGGKRIRSSKSQIIYAKSGNLKSVDKNRYFQLYDGKILNNNKGKITSFKFDKIDFNLSKYDSKTTTFPKIQEVPSSKLAGCLYYDYQKKISEFKQKNFICKSQSLKLIKQEFLKRFYKPVYFPLLALLTCLLIFRSKESTNYNHFKFYLFGFIFFILIISEMSLRYASHNVIGMYFFIFFPILFFLMIYIYLLTKFKNYN
jgi:lipopolysaccharide export system permease protein